MLLFFFILSFSAFAQIENPSPLEELEYELPDSDLSKFKSFDNSFLKKETTKHISPHQIIPFEKIEKSGTSLGSIRAGVPIARIQDNKKFTLDKKIFVKYFNQEDENQFKYLLSKNNQILYKIDSRYVIPINEDIDLYETPHHFQSITDPIKKTEYDDDLKLNLGFGIYSGYVSADFVKDLTNNSTANGISNQFSLQSSLDWNYFLKPGLILNYEKIDIQISNGNRANYQTFSFGPQLKTKNFDVNNFAYRFQIQMRVSPYSKLNLFLNETNNNFNFNSTDFLISTEFPIENKLGEFFWGPFFNSQTLNFKNQPEIVSIRSSNKTNLTLGLHFVQVFK